MHAGGSVLAGQTNDEPCHLFDNGNADVVLRLEDTRLEGGAGSDGIPTVLTVTHPGMTAFKGMNSEGLVLCTNAIDNGERQLFGGVPRTCLAREILTRRTLPEAIELLEAVPRSIPLLYFLSQPGFGSAVIESAPSRLEIRQYTFPAPGADPSPSAVIAHGNVVRWLLPEAPDKKRAALETALKEQLVTSGVASADGGALLISQESALKALATKPVFVPGGTVEMFVCDPQSKTMRVRFMTDGISGGGCDFEYSEDEGTDRCFTC